MFLAGKVEETPKSLSDVISKAFEVMIRKNPEASKKLPQRVRSLVLPMFIFSVTSPSRLSPRHPLVWDP